MQEIDELALLEAWYEGGPGGRKAEEQLYRRLEPVLTRFFRAKALAQDIGDLVHTTWTTIGSSKKLPQGYVPPAERHGPSRLRGFFLRFASNILLQYYRRQTSFDPDTDSIACKLPSISSEVSRLRRHERLHDLMMLLPLNMHLILEAMHRLDLSTRELA